MQRTMLKSKIHRATVTACDVDYVGSITIDAALMRAADLLPNEQVHVWDVDNGTRFVTYVLEGAPGSGSMQVNGAAALLVERGHKVIVASFATYDAAELATHDPAVVHVDAGNAVALVGSDAGVLMDSPLASAAGFERTGP
ncbi:aspartate 1-decarboxylase [Actinopolymorpha singaporensis]|uniref:Aspartate 1-decarboxylase n=1 Tax=Actinopolymorpha singaporensis TaxID=117157 RepID=A0A1H1YAQ4_9ACTN|nr:aspartate 1-decarboxylase [Actinopolymorpha singaporensis]SDT18086.1 L-aspartate 1-decarboxylase [Actinopolymorpha singaporensis]